MIVMTNCVVYVILTIGVVQSQDISNMTVVELVELIGEVIQIREGDVAEADLTLFLFTRNNSRSAVKIFPHENEKFDINVPAKFLIHGWLENHLVEWYDGMKNELLKYGDINLFQVDWSRVAKSSYISSAKNTQSIGIILGKFILENEIPMENVHLIGHSLGSHVAGFAAKHIKQQKNCKIERITALDPAGPYFRLPKITENERLTRDDAEIVDVLHTDGGLYGFDQPIGSLDIYINGGRRRQPGCHDGEPVSLDIQELIRNAFCSHSRSHEYFTQSLNNAHIICRKCASYQALRNNACSDSETFVIFNQNVTSSMLGICAIDTNAKPPYFN